MLTYKDFLTSEEKAVLPSGKTILVSDIGSYKTRLIALRPVEWKQFDRFGNKINTMYAKPGTVQGEIDNSFISGSDVLIQFSVGSSVWQAVLSKENFDLAPLENLPDAKSQITKAENNAIQAIETERLSKLSFFDQITESLKFNKAWLLIPAGIIFLFLIKKK